MGAEVTVCEVLPRILSVEDEEVSAFAKRAFEKQGMKILTGATVSNLKKGADNVTATITVSGKSERITVDRVISAVGIVGNVENLGLEGTKVKVEKTHIVIDQWGFTGEPNVYALGDVAGPPWLAHKAMHEGVLVVEKIAGVKGVHPMITSNIPGCTYCQPQVASIGLTEAAAKAKGLQLKVGKFPFIGNGKAIALGEPEGFIKTIFDAKTGELLGAHMIGAEVTELIQGYSIAKTLETTEAELMATVFPHPTLSEMMHESGTGGVRPDTPYLGRHGRLARQASAEPGGAPPREGAPTRQSHPAQAGLDSRARAQLAGICPRPKRLMRQYGLTTVCEEAACPNIGECWKQKHATFMIMGRDLHSGLRLLQCGDRQARRAQST